MAAQHAGNGSRQHEAAVLTSTIERLRAEVEELRYAMRGQAVIEQARGLLVERTSCSPDDALDHLTELSRTTGRPLVETAAELLGLAAPPEISPADLPAGCAAGSAPDSAPPAAEPAGPRVVLNAPGAARCHLVASALATARTPDELACVLHQEGLAGLGAASVALAGLEPDGALVLTGTYGVPAAQVSQWQRIPPQTPVPLVDVVRGSGVVWVASPDDFRRRYPLTGEPPMAGRAVCALPLRTAGRTVGALSVGWAEDTARDEVTVHYLLALGQACAAVLARLAASGDGRRHPVAPSGEPWFRAVLDALLDPVLILSAVRDGDEGDGEDGGKVTDFRVEHANTATVSRSTEPRCPGDGTCTQPEWIRPAADSPVPLG